MDLILHIHLLNIQMKIFIINNYIFKFKSLEILIIYIYIFAKHIFIGKILYLNI